MRPGQQRPGNWSGPPRTPGWCTGFNEAGATTPRKHAWFDIPRARDEASMRPGQQRPGNRVGLVGGLLTEAQLQ